MKKKDAPDLMEIMPPKKRRGRPPKVKTPPPAPNAEQIADDLEKRGKELIHAARILRGRVKQ